MPLRVSPATCCLPRATPPATRRREDLRLRSTGMTMLPLTHLFQIVLRRAEAYPTDVAIGGQEGLTWKTLDSRELLERTNQLADELAREGIRAGDRVVVWLPSGWRTPV